METEVPAKPAKDPVTYKCFETGKEKLSKSGKLPRGWKVIRGEHYSPDGWKRRFMTRGLQLAVGWPVDKDEQKRWRDAVRAAERQARYVANFVMSLLWWHDLPELGDDGKLTKKYEPIYSYPFLTARFTAEKGYYTGLLVTVSHSIASVYMRLRWELAAGRRSLPSFRSYPYPIRKQDIKLYLDETGRIRFKATIARERFDLELVKKAGPRGQDPKPGRDNSRTYATLASALEAGLPWMECRLKMNKHGQPVLVVVMMLDKPASRERRGMFHVRSDKDALLVCLNDKEEQLWIYNADQLISYKFAHKRMLQRLSDDTKFEDRPTPGLSRKRDVAVDKQRRRVKTQVEQIAARVVNYADRYNLAALKLDLRDKSFSSDFNWFELKRLILQGCDKYGISVDVVDDPRGDEDPEAAIEAAAADE